MIVGTYTLNQTLDPLRAMVTWSSEVVTATGSTISECSDPPTCATMYMEAPKINFLLSTSATQHLVNESRLLSKVTPLKSPLPVSFQWQGRIIEKTATKVGHLMFTGDTDIPSGIALLMTRVLLVPDLQNNVISLRRLLDEGYDVEYTVNYVRVLDPGHDRVVIDGKGERGYWKTDLICHDVTEKVAKQYTPLEIYEVEQEMKFSLHTLGFPSD